MALPNQFVTKKYIKSKTLRPRVSSSTSKWNSQYTLTDKFGDNIKYIIFNKATSNILSTVFILLGIYVVFQYFSPQINNYINAYTNPNIYNQSIISLVNDIDIKNAAKEIIASPEVGYFSKILAEAKNHEPEIDNISASYKNDFQLKIPSINLNAKVKANVSDVESEYRKVLDVERKLAHYKGNPIPGQIGNTFIYGHSIQEYLFKENQNDPLVEFTKLFQMKLGDKIYVEIDNKTISYTVNKIKQIEPTDFSILQSDQKKMITLMTCGAPPGDSSYRWIVSGIQDQ